MLLLGIKMSKSDKPEKGRRMPRGKRSAAENKAIKKRHTYGRTEKILRRNRKLWARLLNKIRRRADKKAIND